MKKLLITFAFSALFFSCQKQNNQNNDTKKTSSNNEQDSEENITVSMWYPTKATFPQGESAKKNRWIDAIKENTGVNYKVLFALPNGQDYVTKVNLAVSSMDLADYMPLPSTLFYKLMDADQLLDITQAFNKVASPELRKRTVDIADGKFAKGRLMKDGKLYGVSRPGSLDDVLETFIRQNWIDNLGLEVPQSMDDFENVLKAFVNNDPDGNGIKDTIGFAMGKDLFWGGWTLFSSYYGTDFLHLVLRDDKFVLGSTTDEALQAIKTIKRFYEEGLIQKEFYTKSIWSKEPVIKDKAGSYYLGSWGPVVFSQPTYQLDKTTWTPFYIKKDGKAITNKLSYNFGDDVKSLRKDFKYPEKIIKTMNFLVNEYDNNPDWIRYKLKKEDDIATGEVINVITPYGFFLSSRNKYDQMPKLWDVIQGKGDKSTLKGDVLQGYENYQKFMKGDKTYIGDYDMYNPKGSISVFENEVLNKGLVEYEDYFGPPTEAFTDNIDKLLSKCSELFISMVIGSIDIESGWKQWIDYYNANGGPEIEKEAAEWYAKNKV